MADNKTITDGISSTIPVATDEIAGVNYQRIKLTHGADGTATDASSAAPLPVDDDATQVLLTSLISQLAHPSASTGAVTAFTATTSTLVFSSNASARLRTFANDSNVDLYLYFRAAAVSVTVYHAKVAAGAFFTTDYTGEVRGILSAAIGTGQVNCGEFT